MKENREQVIQKWIAVMLSIAIISMLFPMPIALAAEVVADTNATVIHVEADNVEDGASFELPNGESFQTGNIAVTIGKYHPEEQRAKILDIKAENITDGAMIELPEGDTYQIGKITVTVSVNDLVSGNQIRTSLLKDGVSVSQNQVLLEGSVSDNTVLIDFEEGFSTLDDGNYSIQTAVVLEGMEYPDEENIISFAIVYPTKGIRSVSLNSQSDLALSEEIKSVSTNDVVISLSENNIPTGKDIKVGLFKKDNKETYQLIEDTVKTISANTISDNSISGNTISENTVSCNGFEMDEEGTYMVGARFDIGKEGSWEIYKQSEEFNVSVSDNDSVSGNRLRVDLLKDGVSVSKNELPIEESVSNNTIVVNFEDGFEIPEEGHYSIVVTMVLDEVEYKDEKNVVSFDMVYPTKGIEDVSLDAQEELVLSDEKDSVSTNDVLISLSENDIPEGEDLTVGLFKKGEKDEFELVKDSVRTISGNSISSDSISGNSISENTVSCNGFDIDEEGVYIVGARFDVGKAGSWQVYKASEEFVVKRKPPTSTVAECEAENLKDKIIIELASGVPGQTGVISVKLE